MDLPTLGLFVQTIGAGLLTLVFLYLARGDGNRVARARAEWVYVDSRTGQPLEMPEEFESAFPATNEAVDLGIRGYRSRKVESGYRYRTNRRVQSYELTKALVDRSRAEGFQSVNIDLIYGLPYQSVEGFRRTLEQVLEIRPDRVAVYSFAFVPWIKAHMKHFPVEALPDAGLKLQLLGLTIDAFTGAGYRFIGMDHFALPEDELSKAVEQRRLHRNFMGYTVQSARDMVALGISGIGDVQGAYVQNVKKLPDYYGALRAGRFPIDRGYALDEDDVVRRFMITQLMCNSHLDVAEVERLFGIDFAETFAAELTELTGPGSPAEHGLVTATPSSIEVTPLGRLFVRNVCMVFDRYLRAKLAQEKPIFSRTV